MRDYWVYSNFNSIPIDRSTAFPVTRAWKVRTGFVYGAADSGDEAEYASINREQDRFSTGRVACGRIWWPGGVKRGESGRDPEARVGTIAHGRERLCVGVVKMVRAEIEE